MTRSLLLVAIALSVLAPVAAADAGAGKKHRSHHARRAPIRAAHQNPNAWQVPVVHPHGPPWAMPNECFNDEGYGRWTPCVGRPF